MSPIRPIASRTRSTTPGTAIGVLACAISTLVVLVVAMEARPAGLAQVAAGLSNGAVLADPDFDAQTSRGPGEWLTRFYHTGDARYLNYAEAALGSKPVHSIDDDLIRIRLDSAAHRFRSAAILAKRVIEAEPRNTEARLLRANALLRVGDVSAARSECLALAVAANALVGRWCAVQVLLSQGRPQAAHSEAQALSGHGVGSRSVMQRWSAEVAAEAAALAGHQDKATAIYRRLVDDGASSFSARLAYADLLLQRRQADAVLRLLAADVGRLPAQVRIAIAMKLRGDTPDPRLHTAINDTFRDMSADRVADLRLRDRAVFELYYNEDPQLALRYALANWQQQKGPEDLSLLREAAIAANDVGSLAIVSRWASQFEIEEES